MEKVAVLRLLSVHCNLLLPVCVIIFSLYRLPRTWPQSKELTRGPPRVSSALDTGMVWQQSSPTQWGGGGNFLVQLIFTCRRYGTCGERGGGWGSAPCVRDTVQYLEKAALGGDKTDEPVTGRVSKPDLAGASLHCLSDILCNINHTSITEISITSQVWIYRYQLCTYITKYRFHRIAKR